MDASGTGPAALVVDGGDGVRSARRTLRRQIVGALLLWVSFVASIVVVDHDLVSALVYGVVLPTLVLVNRFVLEPRRARQRLGPYGPPDTVAGRIVVSDSRWWRPRWRLVRGGSGLVLGVVGVTVSPRSSRSVTPAALRWDDIDRIEVERRRWRPLVVVVAGGEPVVGVLPWGRRTDVVAVLGAALAHVEHRRATDPALARPAGR